MKVKIFSTDTWEELEEEINDFLDGFANIEKISFTKLSDNGVTLCAYEGMLKEEYLKLETARLERQVYADTRLSALLGVDDYCGR